MQRGLTGVQGLTAGSEPMVMLRAMWGQEQDDQEQAAACAGAQQSGSDLAVSNSDST